MIKKIVFGIIGLGLVALIVFRVVQASGEQEVAPGVEEIRRSSGIPVEVTSVQTGPLVVAREYTGTVRGIRSATIRARTKSRDPCIALRATIAASIIPAYPPCPR